MTGRDAFAAALLVAGLALGGCRQDMHDQPRIEPLEANSFFADGMGARRLPAGTVARGQLFEDRHLHAGQDESGELVDALPPSIELDREILLHGQERFEIYCSPCHDATGGGRGMIVRRGFKQPRPYWEERLVAMPLGYFFDVMTQGYGVMSSYARQVPVEDRWAIAAYIRVLQASRTRRLEDLPDAMRTEFHDALARAAEPQEDEPSRH